MKTKKENRNLKEFMEDRLSLKSMILLRGGDGEEEDPGSPIGKDPWG